jgi:thiamine-monophosphate kinase
LPLAEKSLIRRIRSRAGNVRGIIGIGDDCACIRIPPGHEALITTDFSLEGIHFRRKWMPAASVGHRCLLRGLSDIAAMGGTPVAAFLSLALPDKLPQRWVDEFLGGLLRLASKFGVPLAGGDTSKSPQKILADIVVLGSVPKGKATFRSGARPGDRIFVTGTLGGASAALTALLRGDRKKIPASDLNRYFYPSPRVQVGRILREKGLATSMIDISDGLSTDLVHICEESEVGAEVIADAIPHPETDLRFALHGGEDYELLFTAPVRATVPASIANVPVTEIGRIVRIRKVSLQISGKLQKLAPVGWEHFRK